MKEIDINLVKERIEKLDTMGKTPNGGTSRLSYSEAWRKGQAFVTLLMEEAGMNVERDPIGNLIGTYPGTSPKLPYLMVGSHLDTVPEGGGLDGALGVIAAIECIRIWHESGFQPLRTIKIIGTVEEEGYVFGLGCLGSRYMAGELTPAKLASLADKQGKKLLAHLKDNDLENKSLSLGIIKPTDLFAFLELHVEQGYELDLSGEPCAIVTEIVGIDRYWVTIQGHANHAGTTRMDRRRDALVAASVIVQYVYNAAYESQGRFVTTIGTLKVTPGATNVIPGKVEFTIETRAPLNEILDKVHEDIKRNLQKVEERYGVTTIITDRNFTPAVTLDNKIVDILSNAAEGINMSVRKMPSWAGHDAKIMASITHCGMLFVTSVNGISHSPEEATRWNDVEKGIKILNQAMKFIALLPR